MAVKDVERYRREYLEVYGIDAPPSVIKPATASPAAAA